MHMMGNSHQNNAYAVMLTLRETIGVANSAASAVTSHLLELLRQRWNWWVVYMKGHYYMVLSQYM